MDHGVALRLGNYCPKCGSNTNQAYLKDGNATVWWCPCGTVYVTDGHKAVGDKTLPVYSFYYNKKL